MVHKSHFFVTDLWLNSKTSSDRHSGEVDRSTNGASSLGWDIYPSVPDVAPQKSLMIL